MTDEQNEKTASPERQEPVELPLTLADPAPIPAEAEDTGEAPETSAAPDDAPARQPKKPEADKDRQGKPAKGQKKKAKKQKEASPMQQLLAAASEEDAQMNGRNVMQSLFFGDIIWRRLLKKNVWLVLLIVVFTTAYVAVRYQCQRDLLTIDNLQRDLQDAKIKAMTSSSNLTERTRESHILNALRQNRDSTLRISEQPPYIIEMPEQ